MKKNGKVTQKDVAAYLGLNQTTISRILAGTPRFTYSEQTRSKVFEAATRLGYLHPAVVKTEKRSSLRHPLPAQAHIKILLRDGKVYSTYTAELVNLNKTGVLLKGLAGKKRALPLEPFMLELEFNSPLLGEMRAQARPVRFSQDNGTLGLGVAFVGLSEEQHAKIERFIAANTPGESGAS